MCTNVNIGLCMVIGFTVITLLQAIPVEIVYTGDGCDCPRKLGYNINVPRIPKQRKYAQQEYGYRIEEPVQAAKARVSYSFDFTVEEPKPPKPERTPKLNLFAKVDRIALNKADCESNYAPPDAPSPCSCGQCGSTRPLYRYVYKRVPPPCTCQRQNCKCNQNRILAQSTPTPAALLYGSVSQSPDSFRPEMEYDNNIRRKRDLHKAFFRPRKYFTEERPGKFVKMYHKSIKDPKNAVLGFNDPFFPKPTKRQFKKVGFLQPRSKRDIKGEYDLLEKDHEQMDLKLPEIVQYMPETLQANFKRGQCHFGCSAPSQPNRQSEQTDDKSANPMPENDDIQESAEYQQKDATDNAIDDASYSKLDTDNYYDLNQSRSSAAAASTKSKIQTRSPSAQNAYGAQQSQDEAANPIKPTSAQQKSDYSAPQVPQPSVQSAIVPSQSPPLPRYVYDMLSHKYLADRGNLRTSSASISVPDPTSKDHRPLQYAGDLDVPRPPIVAGYNEQFRGAQPTLLGSPNYPVHRMGNEDLDRAITDIVFRHPDFIDATSHYGGALVDPMPWQEQDTKQLLKQLIDGRLSTVFGKAEEPRSYPLQSLNFNSDYRNPFANY